MELELRFLAVIFPVLYTGLIVYLLIDAVLLKSRGVKALLYALWKVFLLLLRLLAFLITEIGTALLVIGLKSKIALHTLQKWCHLYRLFRAHTQSPRYAGKSFSQFVQDWNDREARLEERQALLPPTVARRSRLQNTYVPYEEDDPQVKW